MTKVKIFTILLVLVIFSAVSMIALAEVGVRFSGHIPSNNGNVVNPNTRISVEVDADANLVKDSARIQLNETTYNATFNDWYTLRDGEIFYNASGLRDGSYDAMFSIKDVNGNTGSTSWKFNVVVRPVISELTPARNSSHSTVSLIRAKVTDANDILTKENILMTLNGQAVNEHTYDASTKYVSYQVTSPLPAGTNTVWIKATDAAGNSRETTWSFNVTSSPPSFSSFAPATGAVINNFSPNMSVRVTDASSNLVNSSVVMFINGTQVTPTFTYDQDYNTGAYDYKKGTITFKPQMLTDGSCTVLVRVRNEAGITGEGSWAFTVAVPPTISSLTPVNNSSHNFIEEMSAVAIDPNGEINPSSIQVKLNGSTVDSERISFNATTGKITVSYPEGLPNNNYSVSLEVADLDGNKRTVNWSFTVNATPPVFKNIAPVNNSTINVANPVIRVDIEDADKIKSGTPKMYVDGEAVNATFEYYTYYNDIYELRTDYTKGTLTFQPIALANGEVNVSVEAIDEANNKGEHAWLFTVAAPPKILEISPKPTTTLNVTRPTITVDIYSNEELQNINFTINGVSVMPEVSEISPYNYRLSYKPGYYLEDEQTVQFALQASGVSGFQVERNWSYYINVKGEMPGTGKIMETCNDCHDYLAIKQQSCGTDDCHASYEIEQWRGWQGYQSDCFTCHLDNFNPDAGLHHRYDLYPHDTILDHTLNPEEIGGCRSCHSPVLTREHNRTDLTCGTCHDSTNEDVLSSILAGEKDCMSCHDGLGGGHPEHNVSFGAQCVSCHSDNMMTETVRHNNDCGSCHNSTDEVVLMAIEYNKDSCFACHEQPHDVYMVSYRSDVPLYSGVEWGTPQNAAIWAGETWLPEALQDSMAELIFSSRANLQIGSVYTYYQNAMIDLGWVLQSDTYSGGASHATLTYTKGSRTCVIWMYSGDVPDTGGTGDLRLQIGYH
jgi:hypothetical protein